MRELGRPEASEHAASAFALCIVDALEKDALVHETAIVGCKSQSALAQHAAL